MQEKTAAKHTIEEMRRIAGSRGGACLSEVYVNRRTPLTWRCAEGHCWDATPAAVTRTNGTWCPVCFRSSRRGTLEAMQRIAAERGGRCLSERYMDANIPLVWECASGHRWEARPSAVKHRSWCPHCAIEERCHTLDTMRDVARQHGGECLADQYVNNATPLRWQCAQGHEWLAAPNRVLQGAWCLQCYWDSMRSSLTEMQALAASRGGRCLSKEYVDSQTRLLWECHRGHTWQAVPNSIRQGTWCAECAWLERSIRTSKRRRYEAVEAPDIPPARRRKNHTL